MDNIEIEITRVQETDDDIILYYAKATRNGFSRHGSGYTPESATRRAKENLIKAEKDGKTKKHIVLI